MLEKEGLNFVIPFDTCEELCTYPVVMMQLYIPLPWQSRTTTHEGLWLLAGSFSAIASIFVKIL